MTVNCNRLQQHIEQSTVLTFCLLPQIFKLELKTLTPLLLFKTKPELNLLMQRMGPIPALHCEVLKKKERNH